MGGLFAKIFGGSKVAEQIIDLGAKGLDKLVHTSEEKSDEARQAAREAWEQVVGFMEATKGQNIARRFLAILTMLVYFGLYVLGAVAIVTSAFLNPGTIEAPGLKESFVEAYGHLRAAAQDIETVAMLVMAFYFGGPHVKEIMSVLRRKDAGRTV